MDRTIAIGLWVALVVGLVLFILHFPRVGRLFRKEIHSTPRRRLFLASLSFSLTFVVARSLAYLHHHNLGPFHDVYIRGRHVHHLVWGVLLLLTVGYSWLVGISPSMSRVIALLYGAGAALTLDEFALWLNLEDVYWTREGRESIDAIISFGALLMVGIWGRGFFRALGREFLRRTPGRRVHDRP